MGASGATNSRASSSETWQSCLNEIKGRIHQGKRFFRTPLSLPQPLNCASVARVCDELESADSFDGEDLPVTDDLQRTQQRCIVLEERDSFWRPTTPDAARIADTHLAVREICDRKGYGIRGRKPGTS